MCDTLNKYLINEMPNQKYKLKHWQKMQSCFKEIRLLKYRISVSDVDTHKIESLSENLDDMSIVEILWVNSPINIMGIKEISWVNLPINVIYTNRIIDKGRYKSLKLAYGKCANFYRLKSERGIIRIFKIDNSGYSLNIQKFLNYDTY